MNIQDHELTQLIAFLLTFGSDWDHRDTVL